MEERMRTSKKRLSFLLGVFILFVGFILLILLITGLAMLRTALPGLGESVAILEVNGAIMDANPLIKILHQYRDNTAIKAIVVRVDSPGGVVGSVQELYAELKKLRDEHTKPLVASFGNVAASGGYYVACGTNEIFANPGSLTGSIGVILNFTNWEELIQKIGLKFEVVKSGPHKDIGSPSRPMTEEERRIMQEMIDDVYSQFLGAILDSRADSLRQVLRKRRQTEGDSSKQEVTEAEIKEYLKTLSDGRVFSGQQAYQLGLVDHLGTLQDAIDHAAKLGGIVGKPHVVISRRKPSIFDLLTGNVSKVLREVRYPEVSLEYRMIAR
jgi:protease-4